MTMQRTYCRICEAACGLLAETDAAGRVTRLVPDRDHPVSRGFACAKGTRFAEVANHPDRLTRPLVRTRGGDYEPVSWAYAYSLTRERLKPLLDRHGPHALAVYFGNPLAFNALGAAAMVGFNRAVGTRNVYTAGSQDCNNKFAGAELMHGSPLVHPVPDFAHADLAVLFGTNPAISQSSFVHLEGGSGVFDRLVARGGAVVCVDPRRSESAERWGEHVAVRPGTDAFLLLAMLHELRDRATPDDRVEGIDALLALAAAHPAKRAAALTGVPAGTIRDLAARVAAADRCALHMSVGVNQSGFGTLAYVAMQGLAWLTGNLDAEGGLLFHPLAWRMARLARRAGIGVSAERSRVGDFPSILDSLPGGILADEILTDGPERVRALVTVAGDPLASIPGAGRLAEAMEALEVHVSIDLFQNRTGRRADLVLPATSWLERWDVATTTAFFQTAGRLQVAGPVSEAPGAARPEHRILAELGLALDRPLLGSRLATKLTARIPQDRLLAALLRPFGGRGRLGGGLPVPRPRAGRYLGRGPDTPGRRVRFWRPELDGEAERLGAWAARLEEGEGRLFTLMGRRRRLGHNSWLHGGARDGPSEAAAWMATPDLARLGLEEGDRIRLSSTAGEIEFAVISRSGLPAGTVVVPHGLPEVNVNDVIPSGPGMVEPVSGQHWMTGIPVEVVPV